MKMRCQARPQGIAARCQFLSGGWTNRAARCLVSFACVWLIVGVLPSAAGQGSQETSGEQETPAATVGDETLYEKDFLPQIQAELYRIRREEYELKRRALESEINKQLLQAEARERGISEEEWLSQEVDSKVSEPIPDEVEREFVSRMFRGGGQSSREQIAEELKREWVQQAREEFFRAARERAGVRIYLRPPRVDVDYDSSRVQGNPDAQIVLVEFSDFHCPFCQQAYATVKALLTKYDGSIKVAYRDLPLQEVPSIFADSAEAARCAGEQGKFWEYHDLLFENPDDFGEQVFKEFAEFLNLNGPKFAVCLESGKFKVAIQEDFQEGIRLGATGTPYFFINGIPLNGARPQSEFEEIIDGELALLDPMPAR